MSQISLTIPSTLKQVCIWECYSSFTSIGFACYVSIFCLHFIPSSFWLIDWCRKHLVFPVGWLFMFLSIGLTWSFHSLFPLLHLHWYLLYIHSGCGLFNGLLLFYYAFYQCFTIDFKTVISQVSKAFNFLVLFLVCKCWWSDKCFVSEYNKNMKREWIACNMFINLIYLTVYSD